MLTIACGFVAIKVRRLAQWYVAWRDPAVAANQRLLASKRQPLIGAVGPAVRVQPLHPSLQSRASLPFANTCIWSDCMPTSVASPLDVSCSSRS